MKDSADSEKVNDQNEFVEIDSGNVRAFSEQQIAQTKCFEDYDWTGTDFKVVREINDIVEVEQGISDCNFDGKVKLKIGITRNYKICFCKVFGNFKDKEIMNCIEKSILSSNYIGENKHIVIKTWIGK